MRREPSWLPLLSEEQLRRLDRRQRRFGELMGPWRERQHHKKMKPQRE